MTTYQTSNCISCGKQAKVWGGHVIAKQKMALGNYIDTCIIAGFCYDCFGKIEPDENGCYGEYDNTTMNVEPFNIGEI